jgi:hypothetical protein
MTAKAQTEHPGGSRWRRLVTALLAPMDAAGLAYFRIAFYGVLVWEAWRFLDHGWVERYFSGREMYFKFWPFTFVEPFSAGTMKALIVVMAVAAAMALLGLFYRLSATALFVLITYFFLVEQARYLNHLYLVCTIAFLMIFVPAPRCCSLDALRRPRLRASEVPGWSIWLLRFQVGVPYFFGGVAKLNGDWLRGEPIREWLADRTEFPVIGEYFTDEPVVWAAAYGSLLLDLTAPFLLLSRRTRAFGFLAVLTFHFMNSRLFDIGIFPWTMIAGSVIFFPPDWPRRVWRELRRGHPLRGPALSAGCVFGGFTGGFLPNDFAWVHVAVGALGVGLLAFHLDEPFRRGDDEAAQETTPAHEPSRGERRALALLALWGAVNVLVPLRHLAIPGTVHWTEEGHNFSWHMKLRDKSARGYFVVTDPASGRMWKVSPKDHLSRFQRRKVRTRPHLIVQFARHLEELKRREGFADVEVRAILEASLNGRNYQTFVDPEVDLTAVPYPWFGHAEWILPLTEPLWRD